MLSFDGEMKPVEPFCQDNSELHVRVLQLLIIISRILRTSRTMHYKIRTTHTTAVTKMPDRDTYIFSH